MRNGFFHARKRPKDGPTSNKLPNVALTLGDLLRGELDPLDRLGGHIGISAASAHHSALAR